MDAARLRRSAEIAAVWSEGIKLQHSLFAVRARPNGTRRMRMTVAAPRSGGGAVQRNRGRRRVREAFRTVIRDLPDGAGSDLVVVAHPAVASAPYAELRAAAAATLATLATHGGT